MKNYNNFLLVVFILLSGIFLNVACENEQIDPCENIICENNGSCDEGICDCPDGFTGQLCENFDSLEIQVLLDSGISPITLFEGGITLNQLYGNLYQGGLIFYLDTMNGTGLVAATEIQHEELQWGCVGMDVMGADGIELGSGEQNTIDIFTECADDEFAAKLCSQLSLNNQDDWFLPSLDELTLMFQNLKTQGHTDFASGLFWSSSEIDADGAWVSDFTFSGQNNGFKSIDFVQVWAIRSF